MKVCQKCGQPVDSGATFCPSCGAPVGASRQAAPNGSGPAGEPGGSGSAGEPFRDRIRDLNRTADTTSDYSPEDIANNKAISVFAYIGILFLVPLLGAKNSAFARFHTNQGLVLFLVSLVYGIASGVIQWILGWLLPPIGAVVSVILNLASVLFLVLMIIGILNAVNGKAKNLPVIGGIRLLK